WRPLPLAEHSVDVVTVVFAPRHPAEFARVLRPSGRVIVVTPRPGHLAEIAQRTGMLAIEPGKDERLSESMREFFVQEESHGLDIELMLSARDVADAAFMGPAGHHLERSTLLASMDGEGAVQATAKFTVTAFRGRGKGA
ncbi:MAG TPA: SAM-dependent methyltransferase, partial [Arthrobacter sp.]|nr:SAM-dependent methyltransferase [Arthrobacter sp.]